MSAGIWIFGQSAVVVKRLLTAGICESTVDCRDMDFRQSAVVVKRLLTAENWWILRQSAVVVNPLLTAGICELTVDCRELDLGSQRQSIVDSTQLNFGSQ